MMRMSFALFFCVGFLYNWNYRQGEVGMRVIRSIRKSVVKKLTLLMLAVAVIPILVLGIVFCRNSVLESRADYIQTSDTILKSANSRLNGYMEQLDSLSLLVLYDDDGVHNEEWEIYNNVQKRLLHISGQRKEIESLLYYFPGHKELYVVNSMGNRSYLEAEEIEEMDWYSRIMETDGGYVLEAQHELTGYDERYELNERIPVFSLVRKYRSGLGEISVLSINSRLMYVEEICKDTLTYDKEEVWYLNRDGGVIFASETDQREVWPVYEEIVSQEKMQGSFKYAGNTIIYIQSEENGTILYKSIPDQVLNQHVVNSIQTMMIMIFFIIVCVVLIGIFLSRRIARPLLRLEAYMGKVGQGDTTVRVPVESTDEIGQISLRFNRMEEEIEQLINEKYKLELARRTAQLDSLIAQINPHFLNNILQSIGGAALEKGVPEIYEAAGTLAKMLRYSIKGPDRVMVEDEVRNVKDYLYIQKFRYEERICYTVDLEEAAARFMVPKLILQPLVENAVVHGVESEKTAVTISFRGSCGDACLSLEVRDDGPGMEEEILEEIQKKMRMNDEKIEINKTSIGLINVYQRLRLEYGGDFEMTVESSKGNGTAILIRIRMKEQWQREGEGYVSGNHSR